MKNLLGLGRAKQTFHFFLIITMSLLLSFSLYARKPAIEPVMGLSIEEYNHVPTNPKNWPDFSNKVDQEQIQIDPSKVLTVQTTDSLTKENSFPVYLAILIGLLPFVILGGVLFPITHKKQSESGIVAYNNVTDITDAIKQKNDSSKKFPKAS